VSKTSTTDCLFSTKVVSCRLAAILLGRLDVPIQKVLDQYQHKDKSDVPHKAAMSSLGGNSAISRYLKMTLGHDDAFQDSFSDDSRKCRT
jgi:hypothetical protein